MFKGRVYDHPTFRNSIIAGLCLLLIASCSTIVKSYPANKPFVFKTNINITGNISMRLLR
ncbi:MAG: hypothetical protein IPO68_15730 [Chitinophagaceae bacterium]|nr:hypothetical protein [Chitinophagaceae bacterium]